MWFLLLLLFVSCHNPKPLERQVAIFGREEKGLRPLLYRLHLEEGWEEQPVSHTEDTMQPIARFAKGGVELTIHTFPEALPPEEQAVRWQGQFQPLYSDTLFLKAIARGGFVGIQMEAEGLFRGKESAFLAVAMRLSPEHYQTLRGEQRGYDYTIKAVGTPDEISAIRDELLTLIASFELIHELPESLF